MPLSTDNKTLALLRSFARRRRRLILLRGVAATTLALVVGMVVVALADRLVIMDTPLRLALSLAAYAGAVAVAWMSAGRRLVRRERPAELARMIESAEPTLRDRLLAAVELGEWANGAAAFREIVRDDAARRAAAVRVEKALPWRMIGWWVTAGAGAVAICVILLAVPNLQFGRMLSRALLPTAEIPRASRYTVAFLEGGAQRLVPGNEPVEFDVVVTGGSPGEVTLEILIDGEPARSVPMQAVEPAQDAAAGKIAYRAAIALDRPATLRAWADDADSRPLAVDVRPRPGVLRFTKSYLPPVYLANRIQPPDAITEESGALEALQGSTARLELAADQPIRGGILELLGNDGEPIAGSEPIVLSATDDPAVLTGVLPIRFDGAYRVQLVAAETGFETRHAPLWPVRALADLPPVIQAPVSEGRPAAADALLGLRARVTDDVGLAWARRDLRLNGGDWQAGAIEEAPATAPADGSPGVLNELNWSGPLDLLPMALMPGDRVEARLVVSDLKGQQAIGSFGEWVIVSEGLDDARIQALAAKRQVAAAALRLAEATAQLELETEEATAKIENLRQQGAADSIQIDQVWLSLSARARSAEAAADGLLKAATEGLTHVSGGRDSRDMEESGEAASHLLHEVLPAYVAVVLPGGSDEADGIAGAEARLSLAQTTAGEAARLAGLTVRLAEAVVTAEQSSLATQEVWVLIEAFATQLGDLQANLAGAAPGEATPEQALAWQQVTRGSATLAARLQEGRSRLDEVRAALASSPDDLELIDAVRILLDRAAERLRTALRGAEAEDLAEALAVGRRALAEALPHLAKLSVTLEEQLEERRAGLDLAPTAEAITLLSRRLDKAQDPWKPALARLGDRASLQERRADLDRDFLSDLALARQAVRAMQASAEQIDRPAGLGGRAREVAEAMRILEAGHGLADLQAQAKLMEQAERLQAERFNLDRWRDWLSLAAELDRTAAFLERAGHDDEAASLVQGLARHRAVRPFQRSLQRPRDADAQPQAAEAMKALVAELGAARQIIEPAMRAARAVLAQEALPLSAWMDQMAEQAGEMADSTRAAADPLTPADAQEAFDERRAELEEAIRHDAQKQDLATEPGRQRLRDADDAIAMLQNDARRTREQLKSAQASSEEGRAEALERAAQAQEASAETLRKLAEHYRNLERGAPESAEASRQALREAEAELGLKERLDAEYERMERLAEMEQLSDAEMLEALEEELAGDEAMQRELGRLADEAAREGRRQLDSATRREGAAEAELSEAQERQQRAERSAQSRAAALAETVRKLAEEDVPQLGERLEAQKAESRQQVDPAAEALGEAAKAAERDAMEEAAESLQEADEALEDVQEGQDQRMEEAASRLQEAQDKAASARQAGGQDVQAEAQRLAAAEEMRQARQIQRQAQRTREQVQEAMREAGRSEEAQDRSQRQAESALEEAAESQDDIARDAQQAAEALERAARHEERLGNQEKSQATQQAAEASRQASQQQVPAAEQAARQSQQPGEARPAVSEARKALEKGASAAQEAAATPDQSETPGQSDRAGSMMAQALDQLDRMLNGQQGQGQQGQQGQGQQGQQGQAQQGQGQQGQGQEGQGQQGQGQQGQQAQGQQGQGEGQGQGSEMARAMAQRAAEAQARAMRNRRLPSTPGQQPADATAGADMSNMPEEAVDAQLPESGGDWGRLPPEVVKDLLQGQRDAAPAEYRDLVEAYYRAIAERARRSEGDQP